MSAERRSEHADRLRGVDREMTQSFFVPGVLPGLNEIISAAKVRRGKWSAYLKMKQQYGQDLYFTIKKADLKPMPRAFIHFEWCEKNQRRDPDNVSAGGRKFILDALVNSGVLKGDGWEQIAGFHERFIVDKFNPGVNVTLEEL